MPPARSGSTRALPRLLLIAAGALLLLRIAAGLYEEKTPPKFADLVQWQTPATDRRDASAATDDRPRLYDFTASWCPPCRQMQREVFANEEEAAFINERFVPVKVTDEDEDPAALELRKRFAVRSLPTLVVVGPAGGDPQRDEGYGGRRSTRRFLERALAKVAPTGPTSDAGANRDTGADVGGTAPDRLPAR